MRSSRAFVALLTAVAVSVPVSAALGSPRSGGFRETGCVKRQYPDRIDCDVSRKPEVRTPRPMSVVAHIDTGVNPYSVAFRDRSPLAYKHPSTYIPGFPADAKALRLTLDVPYDKAIGKDADTWKLVRRGELYWVPGTKIIGAISFAAGGTNCPVAKPPPANNLSSGQCKEMSILDDHGHGTMTGSRAAGIARSLAPDARLVSIEGLGAAAVRWAAEEGWIDVQTNSWLSFVPPPIPSDVSDAFAEATKSTFTLAASGNGTAYITGFAPTPTYLLSTAPPGVVLVGGHDNGKTTLWSGAPPHVVADAYAGFTAIAGSTEEMRPDPIACCTSAASPYAAGGAAALIQEARRLLGDRTTGTTDGVLARGDACIPSGPLADGDFTLDELRDVYFHTAQARPVEGKDDGEIHWMGGPGAPTHVEYGPGGNPFCPGCTTTPVPWSAIPEGADAYAFIGYGGINEHSVKLGKKVLSGREEMPQRESADAQYELDQSLREMIFEGSTSGEVSSGELKEIAIACAVVIRSN